MAMDHARVARDVLSSLGGADNVAAAAHCATRLRLVLVDQDKVDQQALDNDPDIKGTFFAGGMYQIIVGPGDVDQVFHHMVTTGGVKEVSKDQAKEEAASGGNVFSRFIKMIADIFVPVLPALIAGGLMMAINNVLTAEGLFGDDSLITRWGALADYANLINMISAAPFAFLPVLIGFSATKRFGGNAYLGAAMGAAMVSTQLTNAYTITQARADGTIEVWHLFGLNVEQIGYQAMVIPVLAVSWLLASIEKQLHKRLSGTADFLLSPLVTLLLTGFLTFVVVGPLARELSDGITNGISWAYENLSFVGGAIFGFFYSPIVVTGLHQSFPAVEIPLLPSSGGPGDFIFPIASMANIAQGAVALAVFFKTKNAKLKGLAGAGGASAVFGITEPAIFGVNLRLRWPFYIGMGAAAIGAAGVALFDLRAQALGAAGFVGFVSMVPQDIPMYLALEILVFILAFGAAFLYAGTARGRATLGDEDSSADARSHTGAEKTESSAVTTVPQSESVDATAAPAAAAAEQGSRAATQPSAAATAVAEHSDVVSAPMDGAVIALADVPDPTFSRGILGPGIAIEPTGGAVVSPVDGEVLVAFPTGHAYGLRANNGVELLIHIGMDTVALKGEHFTPRVKAGDVVRRGDVLAEVDWEAIVDAGYPIVTPVVVSNAKAYDIVSTREPGPTTRGEELFHVAKKQ